jgi:hypothetical protein
VHEHFDDLTRILGSGLSRRETLRLIVGGLAAAVAGPFFPRKAWALTCDDEFCPLNPQDCKTFNQVVCVAPGSFSGCRYHPGQCIPQAPHCTKEIIIIDDCPQAKPMCVKRGNDVACVECETVEHCKKKQSKVCCSGECCPKNQKSCCGKNMICCVEEAECVSDRCCAKGTKVVCAGQCCPKDQKKCCGNPALCCTACQECKDNRCVETHCKGKTCCAKVDGSDHYCCDLQKECCSVKDVCVPKRGMSESRIDSVAAAAAVQMSVTVRDQRGIGTIVAVKKDNATVEIPPFSEGATEVVVTATKIDPEERAVVRLQVCPPASCGCPTCCGFVDPVIAELRVPPNGGRIRESFAGIPAFEHFLTVQNGSPGLRSLRINVNGHWVGLLRLQPDEIRTVDLAPHMIPKKNIITLAGEGKPGSRALILIGDLPGAGQPEASIVPPLVRWETGAARPGVNLHWGN